MKPDCCPILMNTRAGALHPSLKQEQIEEVAREVGLNAEVINTRSPRHMRALVRRYVAEKAKCVAVVGGDGTVALAVQELAHSKTALGIIPQGTFNNFAMALHLPSDLPSILRVLRDGAVREVDLGKIRDRYFTEAAGVGIFADALAMYGPDPGKSIARAAITLGRLFFSYQPRYIRLTADGQPIAERAVLCTVANTYRTGSAVPIAPDAKVTDGQLDVVIVGDLTRKELIPYFRALVAKRHLNLPKVTTMRATQVLIHANKPMRVHADDQIVGKTPVAIEADPRALQVLVERL